MPTRSEVIRARRKAVGGRRPRCRRGKSCSAACINQNKHCLVDAPTPVEGALPRAVKAIQTRREKLGRKEQKQVLEKRREYAKGKRSEHFNRRLAEMEGKLTDFSKKGNKSAYDKLEKDFIKLLGNRNQEGGPKVREGSIWEKHKNERVTEAKFKIRAVTSKLKNDMEDAIANNDRKRYNKIEEKLLRIVDKAKDYVTDRELKSLTKGRMWISSKAKEGRGKIADYVKKVEKEIIKSIEDQDREKYNRLEGRLIRIRDKLGPRFSGSLLKDRGGEGSIWKEYSGPIRAAEKLKTSDLFSGAREGVRDIKVKVNGTNLGVTSNVLGNELHITVGTGSSIFLVNGSTSASDNLSRRETIAIAREVRRQYTEIVKSLKDGTVLHVTAASGDGRKKKRIRAYVDFGFSDPKKEGGMFGKVQNGVLVPITQREYLQSDRV